MVTVGEDGSTVMEGEGGALLGLPELDTEVDVRVFCCTQHKVTIALLSGYPLLSPFPGP